MVFDPAGLAFVRVKLGKTFGQPDYWEALTFSELDDVLRLIREAEEVERYEAWQHTAYLSALIGNIFRDAKKTRKPFTVDDFMPMRLPGEPKAEDRPQQTVDEMKQIMQDLANAINQKRGR